MPQVLAVDGGVPPRSSSAEIVVRVVNVDDQRLQFSRSLYTFRVPENQPTGTLVGHVTAYDPDLDLDLAPAERQVTYAVEETVDSRMFHVDGRTGAVLTNASLDFELRRRYRLTVTAVEVTHPGFTAVCDVIVEVGDVTDDVIGDRRPRFVFPSPGGGDSVAVEVNNGGRPLNELVCTLSAADDEDGGDNGRLTFRLVSDHSSDPVNFDLDPVTGQLRLFADRFTVCASAVC